MSAGTYNITLEQGATLTLTVLVEDDSVIRNLTGYTARMKIRATKDSDTVLLDLTMGSGLTIPTPANGEILISLTAAQTAAYTTVNAVYDLELVDGSGDVERLLQGTVTLSKEVTR